MPITKRLLHQWDLCAALLTSAAFLVSCLVTRRELVNLDGILVAGVAGGITIGVGAFVVMRNLGELLGREDYGELVRLPDPDESRSQRPFAIVTIVALVTSASSLITFIVYRPLSETLMYFILALILGLALYSILGTITLVGIYRRHTRRVALLRRIRDDNKLRDRGRRQG
ncbi:hypothetical protein GOEFS_124_00410 [Gordonia effusa NBRC 100432]|uniref:Uncharacterized protein n=1 Tax=Gordonia effusa NBRC 100432 TaxID=1077974 RepID=H0R6K8_9ACTN|nr:hypothetical protein GOEFS_124_00410 [Gordonia effusa NBRC 100432]